MAHIGICLPMSEPQVDAEFAHDFAIALAYHAAVHTDEVTIHFRQGSILSEQRNTLLKMSLEAGATHSLFLDTDMRFPKDIIQRMLEHDVPVVAANCAKRRRPISVTAKEENPEDPTTLRAVWTEPHSRGLQRIHVVGTAVMMISTDALYRLDWPWFNQPWVENEQQFIGEDVFFCANMKKNDVALFIDHDLSKEVKHIGKYEYGMDDCLAERALAEAGHWDHLKEGS